MPQRAPSLHGGERKNWASLVTPRRSSPPSRGPSSSHQHCTQQAKLPRAPLLCLLPGAGAADRDVSRRLTETQEKEEGLGRVMKGRWEECSLKRWLSSPKGPFKGNLACSLWGNCFYRKAWNCTLNIFTEHLLCACHESQGCIVWFASRQWMSGPSCTKLCDFLNGHKLIYNTKTKIREYWNALIVPSMSMQQWPYLTSSPEHLPGVQQKASCFFLSVSDLK